MRETTVAIQCDATGLGTGPVDHEFDDDEIPDVVLDAPKGWLVIQVMRVMDNPEAVTRAKLIDEQPEFPNVGGMTNEQATEVMQEWQRKTMEINEALAGDPPPAQIVNAATFYLQPEYAHTLDAVLPGCWDELSEFADLAAKAGADE